MNSFKKPCSTIPEKLNKTVLVVDDNEMIRQMIARILENEGMEVISLSSPQSVLKQSRSWERAPDLMICDICMPELSGVELYQHIEQRFPEQPVLFITGYPDGHSQICHEILNDKNLLRKPFRVAELLQRVNMIIAE